MAIWRHSARDDSCLDLLEGRSNCLFCASVLGTLQASNRQRFERMSRSESTTVLVCPQCGWWIVNRRRQWAPILPWPDMGGYRDFGAVSCLKRLDLSDLTLPLEDVRAYLFAKYDSRHDVHPRLFEQTVASVFESIGFEVEVTTYSNDGGIDIILNDDESQIGVQVKRYKDSIKVEQIRALAGALVLKGLTKGIFVTTSSFQHGAVATTKEYASRGYAIELIDAPRFFDALKLAQRPMYKSYEEFALENPIGDLTELEYREVY